MPSTRLHGWPPATFSALLLPIVLSLPSCMTGLLWGARASDSSPACIASHEVRAAVDERGLVQVAVRLAEDLPSELGTRVGPAFVGQWLVVDVQEPIPAVGELVRLQQHGTGTRPRFALWLHEDGDVRIEASTAIPDDQLAAVHVTPKLRIANSHDEPITVSATASGVLRDPTVDPTAKAPEGAVVPGSLNYWRANPNHPHNSVAKRIAFTPVTVAMDVTLGPVMLLAGAYALTYCWLGGRG